MILKLWILVSNTNLNITGCLKKICSIQKKFFKNFTFSKSQVLPNKILKFNRRF